jgi:hypothetical protein
VCVPKQSQHKSSSPAGCTRAREWAVGVGGQERLESLPHKSSPTKVGWQTRVSAPRRGVPHNDRLTQMWGRKAGSRPPARLPVWHARLRAPRERPVWHARLRAPRERPVWQAQRRADTRVRPYRARGWAEDRVVGEGGRGRQESRPQARKPAPQEQAAPGICCDPLCEGADTGGLSGGGGKDWSADHRHDCRCGTQDCVLHASGRCGKRSEGRTRGSAPTEEAIGRKRGSRQRAPRPAGKPAAG